MRWKGYERGRLGMLYECAASPISPMPGRGQERAGPRPAAAGQPLFNEGNGSIDADGLSLITEPDIRASRVFRGGLDVDRKTGQAMRQAAE